MHSRFLTLGALFLFGSVQGLLPQPVQAQVAPAPAILNFQGRLSRPDGAPVADGTYSVRFSLYDSLTGGTEKWSQTVPALSVRNGVFATLLTGFASDVFANNLWMEIKIGTDAPLAPRQQLVSVAFAMKANSVPDGSITSASIANGAITSDKLAGDALSNLSWLLAGNAGTNSSSHFLGTTDSQPLVFRTNNTEKMRLLADGKLGLGTTTPLMSLEATSPSLYGGPAVGGSISTSRWAYLHIGTSDPSFIWNTGSAMRFGTETARGSGYTEWMRLTSTGRLGIGTQNPVDPLTVAGSGTAISVVDGAVRTRLFSAASGAGYIGTFSNNPLVLRTGDTDRMVIDTGGNVGIGTNSPNSRLHVQGSGHVLQVGDGTRLGTNFLGDLGGGVNGLFFGTVSNHALYFQSNGIIQTVLLPNGNFGLGVTPAVKLDVNGGAGIRAANTLELGLGVAGKEASAGKIGYQAFTAGALDIVGAGTTSANRAIKFWNEGGATFTGRVTAPSVALVSDARYKTNVMPLENPLDTVLALRGVSYEWKDKVRGEGRQLGFIAQEIEKVLPELVLTNADGYKSVQYQNLIPVLVEAIKRQQGQIDQLKAVKNENAALKTQLEALMARMQRLEALHVEGK